MMNIIDYKIMEAKSATNLGHMVSDELKKGWQPRGNMLTTNDVPQKFLQVLVKREKEMEIMDDRTNIGLFRLKNNLLDQVIKQMEVSLKRTVSKDEAIIFLDENLDLLARIVGCDDVDTSDRHRIKDLLE